ncbi:MAG: hypothetical protein ACT4N4_11520, partial [Rhodospirillales bacterium]
MIARFAIAAALALIPLAPAPAQDAPKPLGRNLAGEECEQRPIQGTTPPQIGVYCAKIAAPAAEIAVIERRAEPRQLLADPVLRRSLAAGMACPGEARNLPVGPGIEAQVMACAAIDGGWPRFVLAARGGRGSYFAGGHMTALDLARQVVAAHGAAAPSARSSPSGRPSPARPA